MQHQLIQSHDLKIRIKIRTILKTIRAMIVVKIDIKIFTLNDDCSIIRVNMIIVWNDALTNNTSEIVTKVFLK